MTMQHQGFREANETAGLQPTFTMPPLHGGWAEPKIGTLMPIFNEEGKVSSLMLVRDVANFPKAKMVARCVLCRQTHESKPCAHEAKAGRTPGDRYAALLDAHGLTEDQMVQARVQHVFALWSDDPLDPEKHAEKHQEYTMRKRALDALAEKGDYVNRIALLAQFGGKEPVEPKQDVIGFLSSRH